MACQHCGIDATTKYVEFYQNIGLLFARRQVEVKGNLCRRCIGKFFRSFTLTTLILGWWGLISFCVTPFILLNNVVRYLLALRLSEPGIAALNTMSASIDSKPPSVGSGSFTFKFIYGIIICATVLYFVASRSVGFLEKHAPSANASLHQGEITDESDGEYVGTKIWDDIGALNAHTKSTTWTTQRPELLSRLPYLNDLNAQNDKLQRRLVIERNANLGAKDVCEALAINELGPAVNSYVKALDNEFLAIKNMPPQTSETASTLRDLSTQEDGARQQVQAYVGHRDQKGSK